MIGKNYHLSKSNPIQFPPNESLCKYTVDTWLPYVTCYFDNVQSQDLTLQP